MRYFFSGLDHRYASIFWPPLPDAGLMFTATNLFLPQIQELCRWYWEAGVPLVLDCGIIQGSVTEDEYIEMICRWGGYFTWFASRDVLGSLGRSNGNYNYLRDYLPREDWSKLLYVLQGDITQGFSDEQYETVLQVTAHATPYLGIGGLVRYCRRGQYRIVERYLDQIAERLGPEICRNLHLFGMGNYRILHRYRNIFGGADSSSYLCGLYGEQLLVAGGRQLCAVPKERPILLRENAEMLLSWCASDWPPSSSLPHVPFPVGDPYFLGTFYR